MYVRGRVRGQGGGRETEECGGGGGMWWKRNVAVEGCGGGAVGVSWGRGGVMGSGAVLGGCSAGGCVVGFQHPWAPCPLTVRYPV